MRHRAVSRYKYPTYRGKKISNREAQRRIAQSHGYKTTIHDMPHMIALMKRAGIEIESPYDTPEETTQFVEDPTIKGAGGEIVESIKL